MLVVAAVLDRCAGWLANHVGGKRQVRNAKRIEQVVALGAVGLVRNAEVGCADRELHVGRVDVRQVLQRDGIGGAGAGIDLRRAADADGDVGLDCLCDQVVVGRGDRCPIRVDHFDVVLAVRYVRQIEDGLDVGRIEHLPALRLDLEYTGARQHYLGARGEGGTVDIERNVLVGRGRSTARRRRDARNRQRDQVGADGDGGVGRRVVRLHQNVIRAGLRRRNDGLLARRQGLRIGRIVVRGSRQGAVLDEHFVVAGGGGRIENHAQGLADRDDDLVQAALPRGQRGLGRRAQRKRGHGHGNRVAFGRCHVAVVQFPDVVEDIGTHNDVPIPLRQRRQVRAQVAGIGGAGRQRAVLPDLAEKDRTGRPGRALREVDRVGPGTVGGVGGGVGDGVAEVDAVAHLRRGRRRDRLHYQVGRRRRLDQERGRRGHVLHLVGRRFDDGRGADAVHVCRICHHPHIVGAGQVLRRGEGQRIAVRAVGRQAAVVRDVTEIGVLVKVEIVRIAREIDQVAPTALVGRRRAAVVGNRVVDREGLARRDGDRARAGRFAAGVGRRDADIRHLQERRIERQDGQGDVADVGAFVLERLYASHAARIVLIQRVEAGADVRGRRVVPCLGQVRAGLDDQVVVARNRSRQSDDRRIGIALARLQVGGLAVGIGNLHQLRIGRVAIAVVFDQGVVAGRDRGAIRQIHAVIPLRHACCAVTGVGDGPAHRHGLARRRVRIGDGDVADGKRRLLVNDAYRSLADIVVGIGAFVHHILVVARRLVVALPGQYLRSSVPGARTIRVIRVVVGDDVKVVGPVRSGRRRDRRRRGIALPCAQAAAVVVCDRSQEGGMVGVEIRQRAEIDIVDPALGAAPDGRPLIGHLVGDGRRFARIVLGGGHADRRDLQVRRRGRDLRGGRHGVVGECCFREPCRAEIAGVGLDHQVLAGNRGAKVHRVRHGVALVQAERLVLCVSTDQPLGRGPARVGIVGQVDIVNPGAGGQGTLVLHGVTEAVGAAGGGLRRCDHAGDREVGRHRPDHGHRRGLEVVAVEGVRIVRIDVGAQFGLRDDAGRIGPYRDVVLAAGEVVGQRHLHAAVIAVAGVELAGVRGRAEQDVACSGLRLALAGAEPDRIGPGFVGTAVGRRGRPRPLVGDGVADVDGRAIGGLRRCGHVARDEVSEGHAIDLEGLRRYAVGAIGPFVDGAVGVSLDDDVYRAAIAQRHGKCRRLAVVAVTGGKRGAVRHAGNEHRVGIEPAVERQIDVVGPLSGSDRRAVVGDREVDRHIGPGRHLGRHADVADFQNGTRRDLDFSRCRSLGRVVRGRRAVFVDGPVAVGRDLDGIAAVDVRRYVHLLRAGIGDAGREVLIIGKRAESDRRPAA